MEEKNLQEILDEVWPRVRRKHLFPELPKPRIEKSADVPAEGEEDNQGVGLEMKQKQMTLNPEFIAQMKGKMPEHLVMEALLDHGISHYTFCPWDFQTHLMLYAEAKKVMGDKESAKQVANYFIDIIADTHCVKKKSTEIPELHRRLKKKKVEEIITSLYQKIWGIDLGVLPSHPGGEGHEEVVRRLARIPYLDRSRWAESIRKFARSIKPLI